MGEAPIPLFDGLASGMEELAGESPLLVNFLIDADGTGRPRPGIRAWSDFGSAPVASPVIGMFPWRQYLVFVTADRQIWAWISPGAVIALSSSVATTRLDGSLRPVFTYDSQRVAISGGGAPQQWTGAGLSSRLVTSGSMPDGSSVSFTHIAYLAQRFVGNDYNLSGIFQWTDPGVGNHGTFPIVGAYWQEAEAFPDPTVALYSNTNELFVFGTQTLQVFIPDPTTAFAAGASVQLGCAAPYSIIDTDGSFAWLDDRHRFVQSAGRTFQVLSTPKIANDIMQPGFVVSDCWSGRIHIGEWDLMTWIFPTQKRGFVYDRTTQKWVGEFRSTDPVTGEWVSWLPSSYVFWPEKNLHLVGMSNGTIAEVSFNAFDDLGQTVLSVARTGFQSRGTLNRKLCAATRMQFKRGWTAPPGPAPVVELRYRDDLGAFHTVAQWSTGVGGDYSPVVTKRSIGVYQQRQWELSWSGAGGPFAVTGATETFELGDV